MFGIKVRGFSSIGKLPVASRCCSLADHMLIDGNAGITAHDAGAGGSVAAGDRNTRPRQRTHPDSAHGAVMMFRRF
ncbi:hypothetical protein PPNSA23_46620 [Phyllobacterium phragmitis]|uniref:Uncharacterized protein n=1 Tax=Phyllobacterium phragmitis TaxID=2670329 RepID=A0ABQ0H713_9HYPH